METNEVFKLLGINIVLNVPLKTFIREFVHCMLQINYLALCGGASTKICVANIMEAVLSNELSRQYSLTGNPPPIPNPKKKMPFRDLQLYRVVIGNFILICFSVIRATELLYPCGLKTLMVSPNRWTQNLCNKLSIILCYLAVGYWLATGRSLLIAYNMLMHFAICSVVMEAVITLFQRGVIQHGIHVKN